MKVFKTVTRKYKEMSDVGPSKTFADELHKARRLRKKARAKNTKVVSTNE